MFGSKMPLGGGQYGAQSKFPGAANMGGEDIDPDEFQDDYGDYYDEESPSMEEALMMQQLEQQQKLAAMQQQQKQQTAYTGPGSKPMGANFMNPTQGGTQFGAMGSQFGSGNMGGTQFGAGGLGGTQFGAGSMGGGTQFGVSTMGGTQFGQMGGSGGFTYGMASQNQAAPFGQQKPGAQPQKPQTAPAPTIGGGFTFGSASQFGAIGGSGTFQSGSFGSGALGGAIQADDPYANVNLDLSNIKVKAPKPFEKKTEEEKVEEKSKLQTKSNLKTTKEDFARAAANKRGVQFGKAITYHVEGDSEPSFVHIDKDQRVILDEKDLSDNRDEKERIRAALQAEEDRMIEEQKAMNEWKAKQAAKAAAEANKPPEQKGSKFANLKDPDAAQKPKTQAGGLKTLKDAPAPAANDRVADSYTSDDFEDTYTSVSGSGGISSSTSGKLPTPISLAQKTGPATKPLKKIEESSDVYEDDDFESLSKSAQQMNQALPIGGKKPTAAGQKTVLPTLQNKSPTPTLRTITPTQQHVQMPVIRRENQATMTDEGKYSYSHDPTSGALTMKEASLKRKAEDQEILLAEQRVTIQQLKDQNRQLEAQMRTKDTELSTHRREALNATEKCKRLEMDVNDLVHRSNLYKVEVEELIKQIDMADAKSREREDVLQMKEAEFERKLRSHEDRLLYQRSRDEERQIATMKADHEEQLDELQVKYDRVKEENDYLTTKVEKLEVSNKELRLSKDPRDTQKRLESEVAFLQQQLAQFKQSSAVTKTDSSVVKRELSAAEQLKLQKDLAHTDKIIAGYQDEQLKSDSKIKDLTAQLKQREKDISDLKKTIHDIEIKKMLDSEKVFVESQNSEVDLKTANVMGIQNSISTKQLKDLQDTIINLRQEQTTSAKRFESKEFEMRSQLLKVREERNSVEKQLYRAEFATQEVQLEFEKYKEEAIRHREGLEGQIKELQEKVQWFRQKVTMSADQEQQLQLNSKQIDDLKAKLSKAEDERLNQKDLEKRNKYLEDQVKLLKNSEQLPQITSGVDEEKKLKFKITQLQEELDERDKEIRALSEKSLRQLAKAEHLAPAETSKRVTDLENEIARLKSSHEARVRELEERYKLKVNMGSAEAGLSDLPASDSRVKELQATVAQMTEDRNMLVQRLHASQQKINQLEGNRTQPPITLQPHVTIAGSTTTHTVAEETSVAVSQTAGPAKLNPFFVDDSLQKTRSVTQLLKLLQNHQHSLMKYSGKCLKFSDMRVLLRDQMSETEIANVSKYIEESKLRDFNEADGVTQEPARPGTICIDSLLDHLSVKSPGHASAATYDDQAVSELRRELNRLKREKEDDSDFLNNKIRQLKRQVQQAITEKDEANEYSKQLETQKMRLEKFLKQGIHKGHSTEELAHDVSFVTRRLEMLEAQAEERARDTTPAGQKIEQLQRELNEERQLRENMIKKKNSEVAYFKKELDSLLAAIVKQQQLKATC